MKKFLLLFSAIVIYSTLLHATIRRVGFFLPAVTNVDYPNLQAAHDAASPGDTVLMLPGSSLSANISKPLVLIGPGYFLDTTSTTYPGNGGLQANPATNKTGGQLNFYAGSSGSTVEGCTIGTMSFVDSGLNNIIIQRCDLQGYNTFYKDAGTITIQQCAVEGPIYSDQFATSLITIANLSFNNCMFIDAGIAFSVGGNPNYNVNGIINNCIFDFRSNIYPGSGSWLVLNSVFQNGLSSFLTSISNIVFIDNIACNSQYPFPSGNGNSGNLVSTWAQVFKLTGSWDGQYALAAGSPAKGAGINGSLPTDIGVFGGPAPYILSGIPPIPAIYQISSPQGPIGTGSTYTINLDTRANN